MSAPLSGADQDEKQSLAGGAEVKSRILCLCLWLASVTRPPVPDTLLPTSIPDNPWTAAAFRLILKSFTFVK